MFVELFVGLPSLPGGVKGSFLLFGSPDSSRGVAGRIKDKFGFANLSPQ